jgi:hypothetical protein
MSDLLKRSKWLIVLLVSVGCATLVTPGAIRTPAPSPLTSPPPTGEVLLQYHRSGGVGGFDETWTIYADGRVDHQGRGTGADKQLTPDQVAALSGVLRSADVRALKDSYIPANTCCDRFTYELTLQIDGQTQTIRTMDSAPDEPAALTNLRDMLDRLLRL